ncbi:MAG: hypothetical protein ACX93U_00010 [Salipiger thiooxidans]|uniref:hypothetical protein n=1 Tax=Salipiger thiooxidans TaxID=282683 RepID=UPI001CFA1079|nr:hypothetical protein [Salipiger thiooxidans]
MSVISIVSEGVTDQTFIEELIFEACDFEVEPEFIYSQPARDATDSSGSTFGGWEAVFEFCEEHFETLSQTADFIIVQIDTDCGYHKNFGVNLHNFGVLRSDFDIRKDTIDVLLGKIGAPKGSDLSNVIFAVCVTSLECWIIMAGHGIEKKTGGEKWLQRKCGKDFSKTVESCKSLCRDIDLEHIQKILETHDLKLFLCEFCQKVPEASLKG